MQGQMDHGLANARFNEQQENIAPILDALRKYGSGVAERVSAFADDPAQALYGGFADTMGINLDRPMDEYAEMARNPQAGEIDPNSPAVLEAMGWLPGPMGALGTIAGKGAKLPMDEASRMQRAKDMGFDTDTTLYHGSADKIKEFDKRYSGETTGNNPNEGFFFADDPYIADDYSRQAFNRRYQDAPEMLVEDGIVGKLPDFSGYDEQYAFVDELAANQIKNHPSFLKMENPYIVDWGGERLDLEKADRIGAFVKSGVDETGEFQDEIYDLMKFDPDDIADNIDDIKEHAVNEFGLESIDDIEEWQLDSATMEYLEEQGIYPEFPQFGGIIHKNVIDDISMDSAFPHNQYVVFEPEKIRSVDAKFDPSKKESANLLAGLGGLGLGLNYLGSSEDAAETDKTIPLIDALRNKEFY